MAKARKTAKAPATPTAPAPAVPSLPSPEALERAEELTHTAALAWAFAIRARVSELVEDLDTVLGPIGHPNWPGTALMIETVIDVDVLGGLFRHMEKAEQMVNRLLKDDVRDYMPRLSAACRRAAAECGLPNGGPS